jgi:diguanylate cyclase (GGDEF)-like protein
MESKPFIDAYRGLNNSYLRMVDSLSALRALSAISVQHCSDRELLDKALSVLVANQDLERCSIFLLQGDRLVNVAGMDWSDFIRVSQQSIVAPKNRQQTRVFKLGEGLVGQAALNGQLQHCHSCDADQRYMPFDSTSEKPPLVGSIVSVPICNGDEVLGVLNVSHPHNGFFDQSHERTLRIFSDVLGQLLTNNRLFYQMDELVRQRTAQLQTALDDAEALRRRFEELSVVDDLTQLHNRRFFFPEARSALSRSIRYELPFSILLLDVDHFKAVNDNFGHATGDVVLQQVATVIRAQTREGDILARFGGEEFIMALPNTDSEGAMLLAERIRLAVRARNWEMTSRPLAVSVSIGMVSASDFTNQDSQQQLDELIIRADQALYFGKQHGRDQSCNYAEIACKLA